MRMDDISSLYYNEQNFSAVKDFYQDKLNRLDEGPTREDCLFNVACCYASSGDLDAAFNIFSSIDYKDNLLLYNKALCLYKCGKFQESINYLDEIIDDCEKNSPQLLVFNDRQLFQQANLLDSLESSCLIEALNLKAASLFKMTGDSQIAKNILDKSPVKSLDLIDCVTLNNQAIYSRGLNMIECFNQLSHLIKLAQNHTSNQVPIETYLNFLALIQTNFDHQLATEFITTNREKIDKFGAKEIHKYYDLILERHKLSDDIYCTKIDEYLDKLLRNLSEFNSNTNEGSMNAMMEHELLGRLTMLVTAHLANIYWDNDQYKYSERLFDKTCSLIKVDQDLWTENFAHVLFMMDNRFEECSQLYEQFMPKNNTDSILSVDPVILSNLCVAYVLTGRNNDAEDIIKEVEEEESHLNANNLDDWGAKSAKSHPPSHSRILNTAIETLYCVKNNYDFGLTRMFKTLEPLDQKLNHHNWYHVKRCILELMNDHCRQLIYVRDDLLNQTVDFLIGCEKFDSQTIKGAGLKNQVVIEKTDNAITSSTKVAIFNESHNDGQEQANRISTEHNNISHEARFLRSLLLNLIHD